MSRSWEQQAGHFVAINESGEEVTIYIYEKITENRDMHRVSTHKSPIKRMATEDGRHVNRKEQGVYEAIGFNVEQLTSDDPSAP